MNELHSDIIFDARTAAPAVIADSLRSRGVAYVKNMIDQRLIAYCAQAMTLNTRDLTKMLDKEVNFMPLCFTDRYLEAESEFPLLQENSLKAFADPLKFSGMDRSWYYEGERQFKLWFWRNGKKLPNLLLRAVMNSKLAEVYRAYFGTKCVSPYEHDALHFQRPEMTKLFYPFHQDGSYFSHDPKDHCGITTWMPFNDCGVDSPGLEVYPYKLDEILPAPEGVKLPYTFVDDNEVIRRFGDKLWAPEMKAGDCLIFDNFVLHRTSVKPGMTKERQSADIRVFSADNLPNYVNLHQGWMVDIA